LNHNSATAAAWDARITVLQKERRVVKGARDEQVKALYPHARTFVLKIAEPVLDTPGSDVADVPGTLTLVTPDHSNPARDQFYVGPYPVLGRNLRWDKHFEELDFTASDGTRGYRGHLRLTHSRLRAFGILSIGGNAYSVEYEVPPQRYTVRVAKDAAYLAGDNATITWDTESDRWRNATWTTEPVLEFTYGVNGEEIIGDEKVYTFIASFKDTGSGREWKPDAFTYSGYLTQRLKLGFALVGGTKAPSGPGAEFFPYALLSKMSEFAYDFDGGIVTGSAGYGGTCYGAIGTWARRPAAGIYLLEGDGRTAHAAVHDGALYVGGHRVPASVLDGDTLRWSGLYQDLADTAGLPAEGHLVFSADGSEVTSSSFQVTGRRVTPDEALDKADAEENALPALRASLRHGRTLHAGPGHELRDLIAMSQYSVDSHGRYFDLVQQGSMDDFYTILQNYMDPNLRRQFFNPNPPPPLDQGLYAIAHTTGTKGTDPIPWYGSLSVPYTACALSNFSSDPAAATINGRRAETWLTQATSGGDVMAAQGPLLYQRRYQDKYSNLDWFLADQKTNAAKYAGIIDVQVEKWIADAKAEAIGTPEEMEKLEKQMRALGKHAKEHDQYWAFAIYTYTTTPGYLNMLQTILLTGGGYDGSEFTQRVQRTVALLNVLDTSSYFSQQYGYLLQLFQLGSILPQMFDFSNDLSGFSFAVKQIVDKFIEQYIDSPDPKMREAAQQLKQNATQDLIDKVLQILHASAAVGHGVYEWVHVASRFENTFGRVFAHLPAAVGKMIALAGAGAMIGFFLLGAADFGKLSPAEQALVVVGGASAVAQLALPILQRGLALGAVWDPSVRWWSNLRKFFSPKLIDDALTKTSSAARIWLMSNKGSAMGYQVPIKQAFAARSLFTANSALPFGQRFKLAVMGRNLGQFTARLLGSAFAIIGIVLSSIALSQENEPLELAANILFLTASVLELVAIVGGWAVAGSAVAVGGLLVSTIFAIVSVVGVIALVAGIILIAILMSRPTESPVETFAKSSGTFYMPFKTAIEYFQVYQPAGQPQRAGVAVLAGGDAGRALKLGSDGSARVAPYDGTGHTAFYISTDSTGRVQIAAPILDSKNVPVLYALAAEDTGAVVAKGASGKDASLDTHLLWYTEVVGEGTYEESGSGNRELRAAPFKLYTALNDGTSKRRYLDVGADGGWTLREGDGVTVTLKMEVVKPAELTMADITWYTVEHNQRADAALQVPGSLPRKWTVEPHLPDGIEFLPEDGAVQMREGVDVPPASKQAFKLTCSNDVGTVSTEFSLSVLAPGLSGLVPEQSVRVPEYEEAQV